MVTDFITIDTDTIVLMLLNTLILFLVLRHFLFNRVNKVIKLRQEDVAENYASAEQAKESALAMESEYKQRLMTAKDEANELLHAASKKAQLRGEEIVAEAKRDAEVVRKRAEDEIERERKRALNQVKDDISDLALLAAARVIEREINPEDHERMLEEFLVRVGDEIES